MKKIVYPALIGVIAILTSCSSSKNIGSTSLPDPQNQTEQTTTKTDSKKAQTAKSSKKGVVVKENPTLTESSTTNTTTTETVAPVAIPEPTKTTKSNTQKVVVKEESVTVIPEVGKAVEPGKYYVIMGSFKVLENAQKFKSHLIIARYNPILLQNSEGLYRVAVGVFAQEAPAREKINTIRSQSDKYNDVWLLIQKN